MKLYRIMLVDDEEEVRKSMIKTIDWEKAGFRVVGDAENGEEALEKIEGLEPDVLLTDIRMPYMDGLVLTEKIRQKYPSMKVLIFSGFDDFEYAQRAIKLNVTEYILKPVNVEELTAILTRIKGNLDEEIEQKRNVSLLRESYRSSLPIIRELFLNDLVLGEIELNIIEEKLTEYNIDISGAPKWVAAVIDIEQRMFSQRETLSFHKEEKLIPISVKRLVEEKLRGFCRYTIFNSSSGMVIIVAIDESSVQDGLIDLLRDICKETKRILEVTVTIGMGRNCHEISNIHDSFQSAVNAVGYKAIVGSGNIICIGDVEPVNRGKLQFDSKEKSELIAAIKFGTRDKIDEVVSEIVEKMDDARVHFYQYRAYMLSVVDSITQLMQQYDLNLSEMFGSGMDYFEALGKMQDRGDFSRWLLDVAYRMNDTINEERYNTTKNVIRGAKQYIQDNYQDPDLSVEKICCHLHMSPAYFSTMFKKETGQAYIAYLTEVRLNRAVELLNQTDDKTYIIASKVGYQEQNYFSYVFKKQFGVSPTKYRGGKS